MPAKGQTKKFTGGTSAPPSMHLAVLPNITIHEICPLLLNWRIGQWGRFPTRVETRTHPHQSHREVTGGPAWRAALTNPCCTSVKCAAPGRRSRLSRGTWEWSDFIGIVTGVAVVSSNCYRYSRIVYPIYCTYVCEHKARPGGSVCRPMARPELQTRGGVLSDG